MRDDGQLRVASVEHLSSAMHGYAISAIKWIGALFSLGNIDNVVEKVCVLIV